MKQPEMYKGTATIKILKSAGFSDVTECAQSCGITDVQIIGIRSHWLLWWEYKFTFSGPLPAMRWFQERMINMVSEG